MFRSYVAISLLSGIACATPGSANSFYDAALCKPPYTMDSATALYEAAEKLAKPDTSMLTAYVYTLPQELGQDGFKSRQVIFAGTTVGILVDGLQADALAERYHLTKERSALYGTSTKGYSLALPRDQHALSDQRGS
jgi:hypothetical protein